MESEAFDQRGLASGFHLAPPRRSSRPPTTTSKALTRLEVDHEAPVPSKDLQRVRIEPPRHQTSIILDQRSTWGAASTDSRPHPRDRILRRGKAGEDELEWTTERRRRLREGGRLGSLLSGRRSAKRELNELRLALPQACSAATRATSVATVLRRRQAWSERRQSFSCRTVGLEGSGESLRGAYNAARDAGGPRTNAVSAAGSRLLPRSSHSTSTTSNMLRQLTTPRDLNRT